MSRRWSVLPLAALGLGLGLLVATGSAQSLPSVFKRYLNMFEGDYQRLAPDFDKAGADEGQLRGYLTRLENHLKKIPKNYHGDATVKAALDKVAGLEAKMAGGPAPAASGASTGMTDPERAREFQGKYQSLYNDMRATRGQAAWSDVARVTEFRTRLGALEELVGGFQDPSLGYAKQCKTNFESLRDWLARAGAAVKQAEVDQAAKAKAAEEVAKAAAAAAAAEKTAASAASSAGPLDFQSKRAVGFFDKDLNRYQSDFDQAAKVDPATLKGYLERLDNRLSSIPASARSHPEVAARFAKVEALKKQVATAADARKSNQAAASSAGPDASGEAPAELDFVTKRALRFYLKKLSAYKHDFAHPEKVEPAKLEEYLGKVEAEFQKIPAKYHGHPEVAPHKAHLAALRPRITAAGAEQAKLGAAIDEQLRLLQELFPFQKFDPSLKGDSSPEGVRKWAERLQAWSKSANDGKAFLEKAASLPKLKKDQDFKVYRTWFPRVQFLIDAEVKDKRKMWSRNVRGALGQLGVKPEAMSESAARTFAARLQGVLPDFDRLQAFQRAYDGQVDPEMDGKRGQLEDVIAKLLGSANTRVERARMPEPTVEQKPELLERARAVLAKPEYGFDEIKALKVMTHPTSHTRTEYFDGTWYTKDWDEYQVSFAHKDAKKGGKWFVRFADVKFYRKAWRTTTQNEWIVGASWPREEIMESNIR